MTGVEVEPHDYEIIRHKETEVATFGRMYDAAGLIVCVTLERPFVDVDRDGHRDPNVSRFQQGRYRCFLRKSHLNGGDGKRAYDVWQFENVPDVEAAQIHIANRPAELEGCIAVGSGFGGDGISGSKNAFEKFMKDSLAICTRDTREHIWVKIVDRFDPPAGTFA